MKINFIELKFKNVLRFGNKLTTINFKSGIDLIVGKNGRGKSTFLDALSFNLFGKPFRRVKLGSLINTKNQKNLYTELIFEVNNRYYKIIRGMKPNIFEIYMKDNEWKLLDQSSTSRDYQKYLEENILHINENIFRQLIALGANLPNAKNFMELSSKEKEEILQVLTNTVIFNILNQLLREKINQYKTLIKEYEYKRDILNSNIESTKNNLKKLEEQNKENREKQIQKYKNDISKIKEEIIKQKEELILYENKLQDLQKLKEKVIPIQEKLKEIENKIIHNNSLLNHIKTQELITCPNCGTSFKNIKINETDINKELAHLNELQNKIKEKINPYLNELANENDLYGQKQYLEFQINSNITKIKELQSNIQELQNTTNIKLDYSELTKLEKEFKKVNDKLLEYKKELKDYNDIQLLLSDKNLKGIVLNQQLPILNKYINEYLEKYETNYSFIITNDLKEKIINRNNETEYNALSNGQKQRIVLSILFAFLKLIELGGVSTNLLVLDEFLDSSLDDMGIEQTLDILKNEFAETKDIFIISHNFGIKNKLEDVNRVFEVTENMGFSVIKQF